MNIPNASPQETSSGSRQTPAGTPLRLELTGITKQYPAVRANDSVYLRVKPGEIHAVLGENGAGKSTMMKMIYGAVQPDAGEIRFNGKLTHIANPAAARKLGISMVYQHFSLFDTLTAAENVWLGLDKSLTLPEVSQRIVEVAHTYGLDVDPVRPPRACAPGAPGRHRGRRCGPPRRCAGSPRAARASCRGPATRSRPR